MKIIPTLLALTIFTSFSHAAAPAVGSVAENQSFALNSKTGFSSANLDEYEGSILILMMMTPWCDICQSQARSAGAGLLDHFDNPARDTLRGKNDKGVPIQSILLSTEVAASWDKVNKSFSTTNGFQQWGLDADSQRRNPRELLGYFRGGFINSNNLSDWGEDRRRIVVLNLVDGSASHSYREIIINQNSYSSSDNTAARAAINRIAPKAATTTPIIRLKQGSKLLENGSSTVSFGNVNPGKSTALTLTIRNTGGSALTGLATSLSGRRAADYELDSLATTTLAPNETTTFAVTFKPLADGNRNAVLNLTSTSEGVPAFSVKLAGTSKKSAPEIGVYQPRNKALKDGKAQRKFGTVKVRGTGKSLTFRISNTGDAMLTGLSVATAGKNPNDFLISSPGRTRLAPGRSTTFKVTFMPGKSGIRKATIQLNSNDSGKSPFAIRVTGNGVR